MKNISPIRVAVSASLLTVAGAVVVSTLAVDYMSDFWAYIALQGLGFSLLVAGTATAYGAFSGTLGWVLFLGGSMGWFVCWSWFLSFGLLIPIPLPFWAAASTALYLGATFVAGTGKDEAFAIVTGTFAIGSLGSTVILLANPIFASDFTYIPVGIGAVLGGLALLVVSLKRDGIRGSHSESRTNNL